MPIYEPSLPFGSDAVHGENGKAIDYAFSATKTASITKRGGYIFSLLGGDFHRKTHLLSVMNHAEFVCSPYGEVSREYALEYATVSVTTLYAGSMVYSCIYQYSNNSRDYVLRKLPGSEASFSASTTGRKTYKLQRPVLLIPGALYFIGTLYYGDKFGAPTLQGVSINAAAGTTDQIIPLYVMTGLAALPDLVYTSTAKNYTIRDTALVVYKTQEANELF